MKTNSKSSYLKRLIKATGEAAHWFLLTPLYLIMDATQAAKFIKHSHHGHSH